MHNIQSTPCEGSGKHQCYVVVQAWVLVNRQVYAVPLRVARTFYVNSSLPPEDPVAVALGRKVVRTLPYGQEPFNVYQVGDETLRGCDLPFVGVGFPLGT